MYKWLDRVVSFDTWGVCSLHPLRPTRVTKVRRIFPMEPLAKIPLHSGLWHGPGNFTFQIIGHMTSSCFSWVSWGVILPFPPFFTSDMVVTAEREIMDGNWLGAEYGKNTQKVTSIDEGKRSKIKWSKSDGQVYMQMLDAKYSVERRGKPPETCRRKRPPMRLWKKR